MSTTTNATATSLDAVGAALVAAHRAVEEGDSTGAPDRRVGDALVALACAACDAVSVWDAAAAAAEPEPDQPTRVTELVTRWRGQLDELRVQAALAELELRDSSHHTLAALEQTVADTERRIGGALREIGSALAGVRGDLKERLR